MKRSKEISAEARKTVLQAASEMLRARGVEGMSVSEAMASAGMTHGGFYKLFEDKEGLIEEAFDLGSEQSVAALRRSAEEAQKGRGLQAMVDAYLSLDHRANRDTGCALAAHAGDAARLGKHFRRAFTTGIYRMLDAVLEVASRDDRPARRQQALAALASLVGALALARATDDETLASEILDSVKSSAVAGIPAARAAPPRVRRPLKR